MKKAADVTSAAFSIRQRVHITTCVGIAPTKTLVKLANRLAKKAPALDGMCYLDSPAQYAWARERVAVEDVWGMGFQCAVKLHEVGIRPAADLSRCSESWARWYLGGVVGVRLVRELNGSQYIVMLPSEDTLPLPASASPTHGRLGRRWLTSPTCRAR